MKSKQHSGVWAYLIATGVLDKGTEAIAAARCEYWRTYDRELKAKRRLEIKGHTVNLTPEEHHLIAEGAKKHNLSIPAFLKMASLAYMSNVYVVQDSVSVRKIESVLVRSLTAIERISKRDESKNWFAKDNDFTELRKIIVDMRAQVTRELLHPDPLMTAISKNPGRWDEILKYIGNDFKDNRDQIQ